MTKLVFVSALIFQLSSYSLAQEMPPEGEVMQMVCIKKTSGLFGPIEPTGRVYIVTQIDDSQYPGSIFIKKVPVLNGKIIYSSEDTLFQVQRFDGVEVIDPEMNPEKFAFETGADYEHITFESIGFRMHAENYGAYYYFRWIGSDGSESNIRYNTPDPKGTGFKDGEDGGLLDCLPPYPVSKQ